MTISLPSSWIKKYHLDSGDEIELEESGNQIIISTKKELNDKTYDVDLRKIGKFLRNDLSHQRSSR